MIRTLLVALLITTFCVSGQSASSDPPTFAVTYPKCSYSKRAASVKDIDFQNMNIIIFDEAGKHLLTLRLRKGGSKSIIGGAATNGPRLMPSNILGLPPMEIKGHWSASIGLSVGGSSSPTGVLQVFGIKDEYPFVFQQIKYNKRGQGVGSSFDPKRGMLTIKGVHGWEHCCPTTLDVGTFKWNGVRFQLIKTGSIPMSKP